MKNIRLIGNFGNDAGIVLIQSKLVKQVWFVEFNKETPTNLQLAKLKLQLK